MKAESIAQRAEVMLMHLKSGALRWKSWTTCPHQSVNAYYRAIQFVKARLGLLHLRGTIPELYFSIWRHRLDTEAPRSATILHNLCPDNYLQHDADTLFRLLRRY